MHDFIHGKLPILFGNIYRMNYQIHGIYETRQVHVFHVPMTISRFVDKLPLFQFPNIWNNWYSQMNFNSSHNAMKLHVKSIYLSSYNAAVKCDNTLCIDCHSVQKQSCSLSSLSFVLYFPLHGDVLCLRGLPDIIMLNPLIVKFVYVNYDI